ncbi:helix-turn-helix domain-containing protein [Rhodanobacter glycinis]|uniref:Helix-turn-helix domain-containing protein n=2 Tax=Rhodanobacter glycinis TaxID=582702 RepID=A0A5B9DWQ9_9GAMM|nr:helix-turn-helix domain-containing protein [Rhodanobacter glycinis]
MESAMTGSATGTVRLGTGPRTMLVRPGVGAAGHVVQRTDLATHRVVVEQASLILVEDGCKRIHWSGGECVARVGEALSVQAGEVVDFANTPGRSGTYRALWICWQPELLMAINALHPSHGPRVARHAALDEAFRASFHRAFDGMDGADGLPASVAIHRLQEVLLWLGERGFHFPPPGPVSIGQRVRRLLSADPSAEWSMEQVAHETATSVPTLRRKLATEGVAFRELLHDVRMSHALALLENTDVPVLHVALATGYASASRFSARFRARFGYLPTDIRGQNRGHRR